MSSPQDHSLRDLAVFNSRTVRFESGLPVREAIPPHWRFYCACGLVGGRTGTEANARAAHARHAEREARALLESLA